MARERHPGGFERGLPVPERRQYSRPSAFAVAGTQRMADQSGGRGCGSPLPQRSEREWYRDGGLNEVVSRKMGGVGQPRFLSESQERRLVVEVGSGRFRTAGEIADWVESEYGVRFRGNSIYSVLERLGCSPKVPRPRHDKADLDAQRRWKKGGLAVPFGERELVRER